MANKAFFIVISIIATDFALTLIIIFIPFVMIIVFEATIDVLQLLLRFAQSRQSDLMVWVEEIPTIGVYDDPAINLK